MSCSSQRPRLAQEPRVVGNQAQRDGKGRDGRDEGSDPVLPPILGQAPETEQRRERRGEEDQQGVEPPEVHYSIQKPLLWVKTGRNSRATNLNAVIARTQ